MRAGRLRHRISILNSTTATTNSGAPSEAFGSEAEVWASITPLSGRELVNAARVNAQITTEIRLRYLPEVTAQSRVRFGARTFEVLAPPINIDERNVELVLMCKETT